MSSAGDKVWIDPGLIQFKITPVLDILRGAQVANWDVERRRPLSESVKYRSVVAHFRDGMPWRETELFEDAYRRRLDAGDSIRGARSLDELAARYAAEVDPVFAALRRDGFKASRGLPHFLIGRGGEVFIGNQGNHRLAMAHVLGLDRFAGRVVCRHP